MGDISVSLIILIGDIMIVEIENKIENNTFLEFKTIIKRFKAERLCDRDIHIALYLDHSGYEQFGIIIVDKRGIESKKYISSFASKWCPEENKEWLLQVLSSQMWEMIKESRNNVIGEIKDLKNQWMKLIGE